MAAKEKIVNAIIINRYCEGQNMTEEQIKMLCKWIIENKRKDLSPEEKEIIKQAVDKSKNIEELFLTAFISNIHMR